MTLTRWERATQTPLIIAALLFLVAYATPIIWPGVNLTVAAIDRTAITVIWIVFGVDYVARLALAKGRWHFVRHNVVDLLSIALPILRPLRLLRLVALLSVLNRVGANTLRGKVIVYAIGGTTLLVITAALAATDSERGAPGSTIHGFGDGVWWAFVTLTTVGYGDITPVTTTGRVVAVALMISGVALLGVVTATLSSWLVERVGADNADQQAVTRAHIDELHNEIAASRALQESLLASISALRVEPTREGP